MKWQLYYSKVQEAVFLIVDLIEALYRLLWG